jgi:hypothetical protein
MLKTVKHSGNKKTGPIAVTYRAGGHNVFATCPATCALNPQGEHGLAAGAAADLVDADTVICRPHKNRICILIC